MNSFLPEPFRPSLPPPLLSSPFSKAREDARIARTGGFLSSDMRDRNHCAWAQAFRICPTRPRNDPTETKCVRELNPRTKESDFGVVGGGVIVCVCVCVVWDWVGLGRSPKCVVICRLLRCIAGFGDSLLVQW